MSYAICHTAGCGNENVPIDVGNLAMIDDSTGEPALDGDGNPILMGVGCGVCGQPITDLSDTDPGATSGE